MLIEQPVEPGLTESLAHLAGLKLGMGPVGANDRVHTTGSRNDRLGLAGREVDSHVADLVLGVHLSVAAKYVLGMSASLKSSSCRQYARNEKGRSMS